MMGFMDPSATPHYTFTVVFLRDGDFWLAQALEYDISAQGSSLEVAKQAFEFAVRGQFLLDRRRNREPFSSLPQAPAKYWDVFAALVALQQPMMPGVIAPSDVTPDLPPAYMIQAVDNSTHASR
jgi:hypothetical protein